MQINWDYIIKRYKIPAIIAIIIVSIVVIELLAIFIFRIMGSHTELPKSSDIKAEIHSSIYNDRTGSFEESTPLCARLTDGANLLSERKRNLILEKLNASSSSLKFDFAIVTTNTLNGKAPQDYADDFYDSNNFGYGNDKDGVLLLVSMEDRDWHITTTGFGIQAIDDNALNNIADSFLNDLSSGNYFDAFNSFIDATEATVNQAIKGVG